jgi:hypothetical protein
VNLELVRAVARRDQRRLATSAHEIGHALAAQAHGLGTVEVRLKFGMLGGITGGHCGWEHVDEHSPPELLTAYMIALMGGHAAEIRFAQLYLGMNERKAYKYGRDWAEGDYLNFGHFRRVWRRHGVRISRDAAFARAETAVARHGDRIDALTLRLDKNKYLSGSQL